MPPLTETLTKNDNFVHNFIFSTILIKKPHIFLKIFAKFNNNNEEKNLDFVTGPTNNKEEKKLDFVSSAKNNNK